jgi:peptidoglycan glycosyltransferase
VFVVAYIVLFGRQIYVQAIEGPRLAGNIHDPRTALLAAYRGEILARDGTVLAGNRGVTRVYPLGAPLAQVTGYASARYGTTGLENAFDSVLTARPAASNPLASLLGAFARTPEPPAIAGSSIVTTIDPHVQATLAHALAAYPRAAGVALDPRTGEVLALASVPSFDPARIDALFPSLVHDASRPRQPSMPARRRCRRRSTIRVRLRSVISSCTITKARPRARKISPVPSRFRATSILHRSRSPSASSAGSVKRMCGAWANRSISNCPRRAIVCPCRAR